MQTGTRHNDAEPSWATRRAGQALGFDFLTATSGVAAALAGAGPGLGPIIGPVGNYAPLPDPAKLVMCVAMLLGRLEIFTLLPFLPAFWRK